MRHITPFLAVLTAVLLLITACASSAPNTASPAVQEPAETARPAEQPTQEPVAQQPATEQTTPTPNTGANFAPVSISAEENGYAVGILSSGPISIGYQGNRKYFLDCEEEGNVPEDYVVVCDVNGEPKLQDRSYTFRIDYETTLRIVLEDDVYFAEGDTISVKTGITDVNGAQLESEVTFRPVCDQWVIVE